MTGKISSQLPVLTHPPPTFGAWHTWCSESSRFLNGGFTDRKKFKFPPRESIPRYSVTLLNSREDLSSRRTFIGHDITPRNIFHFITSSLLWIIILGMVLACFITNKILLFPGFHVACRNYDLQESTLQCRKLLTYLRGLQNWRESDLRIHTRTKRVGDTVIWNYGTSQIFGWYRWVLWWLTALNFAIRTVSPRIA